MNKKEITDILSNNKFKVKDFIKSLGNFIKGNEIYITKGKYEVKIDRKDELKSGASDSSASKSEEIYSIDVYRDIIEVKAALSLYIDYYAENTSLDDNEEPLNFVKVSYKKMGSRKRSDSYSDIEIYLKACRDTFTEENRDSVVSFAEKYPKDKILIRELIRSNEKAFQEFIKRKEELGHNKVFTIKITNLLEELTEFLEEASSGMGPIPTPITIFNSETNDNDFIYESTEYKYHRILFLFRTLLSLADPNEYIEMYENNEVSKDNNIKDRNIESEYELSYKNELFKKSILVLYYYFYMSINQGSTAEETAFNEYIPRLLSDIGSLDKENIQDDADLYIILCYLMDKQLFLNNCYSENSIIDLIVDNKEAITSFKEYKDTYKVESDYQVLLSEFLGQLEAASEFCTSKTAFSPLMSKISESHLLGLEFDDNKYMDKIDKILQNLVGLEYAPEKTFEKHIQPKKVSYISKDKHTKGKMSFKPNQFKKFRVCEFYPKSIRKEEKKFLKRLDLKLHPEQYAYIKEKSIGDLFKQNYKYFNSAKVDLSNAFNQVKKEDIKNIFEASGFNSEDCELISTVLTNNSGELFQGGVFSPILYNIFQLPMILDVEKHLKGTTYKIATYADDIIIYSSSKNATPEKTNEILHKVKFIIEDIHGWSINHKKTQIMSNDRKQEIAGLSIVRKDNGIFDKQATSKREIKNKIRMLKFTKSKGVEFKVINGKNITIDSLIKSYEGYLKQTSK